MIDTDRARLIATLTHLKVPFDRKQTSTLPASAGRPALDYVNHAHVVTRLNAQAEDWTYTIDEQFTHGGKFWIRGTMTICGVSRVEYGQGKDPLEAASHFVRRAAMRFGCAADLWAKEDLETSEPAAPAPGLATPGAADHGWVEAEPVQPEPVSGEADSGEPSPAPTGSKADHAAAGDVVEEAGSATAGVASPPPTLEGTKLDRNHEHVWVPSPKLAKSEVCSVDGCFKVRRKSAVA